MSYKKQTEKENNNSNGFTNSLNQIITQAKEMVSKSPRMDIIQKEAMSIVGRFFYSNLITNFKNNLTEANLKELNIIKEDVNKINKEFSQLFERCESSLDEGSNHEEINRQIYQDFKEKLNRVSKNSYKILTEIEKQIDISSCEKIIHVFGEEIKTPDEKPKIGIINKEGKVGISIDFASNREERDSKEIIDFNNFSLSIDNEWVNLEDDKGHFFGQYNISPNKKYLITYCDSHGEIDKQGHESTISGQVYLIQNQNKILWKKAIDRPNGAFVTDDGASVIIDWLAFKRESSGKVYFFDRNGKKLMEFGFNSNIGGQEISKDGSEIIITTCFPENAIYLFNIKYGKLIKKVENNTSKKPVINFNFEEIKRYVIKSEKFNQKEYDLQILKKEQEIKENKERIESLKKKRISDLNYEEIVEIGRIYAGNYYENFGEPKKALGYLLEALRIRKNKPQASVLKLLASCYEKLGSFNQAIEYYELALKRYPQFRKFSSIPDHIKFCKFLFKEDRKFSLDDWIEFMGY